MMPLLAAAAPIDPSLLGNWIIVALISLGGLSTLANIVAIFATRREVEALQKRVEHLEGRIDALGREFGDATRKLTEQIGDLKQDMPLQIVTLLRNTGAIAPK